MMNVSSPTMIVPTSLGEPLPAYMLEAPVNNLPVHYHLLVWLQHQLLNQTVLVSQNTCQGVHVIAKVMAFIGREKKLDGLNQRPDAIGCFLHFTMQSKLQRPLLINIFCSLSMVHCSLVEFTYRKVPELRPPPPQQKKKRLLFLNTGFT